MLTRFLTAFAALAAMTVFALQPASGQQPRQQAQAPQQARIALVLGNAAYSKGPLQTSLADGGLIAEALTSVGFEIVEGADTTADDMRRLFDEFVQKVQQAGPDTIAFVYYNGYALEFDGENYLVPVNAQLARDSDISNEAIRLFDLLGPLADAPATTKIVVLDATRPIPFRIEGAEIAAGLGAVEAPPGMLVAFSSAPGTSAEDGPGPYGPYATAIAEMVREPGLDIDTLFARIRLRTNEATNGAQLPWEVSQLRQVAMLVPGQAAAPPAGAQALLAPQQSQIGAPIVRRTAPPRPIQDYGPEEAYAYAVQRDDLSTYAEYVRIYPDSPYAQRVWATIRARREALLWRRALLDNTPDAYWTYIQRYPDGMYAFDARRRLRRLAAAEGPPPGFRMRMYDDVPMPLVGEPPRILRVLPPGPPPRRFLAPPPAFIVGLPPPPRPGGGGLWRRQQPAFPVIVNPQRPVGPGFGGRPQQLPRGPAVVNQPPPGGPPQPGFQGPPKQWQKPGTGIGSVPPGPPPGFRGQGQGQGQQQFQKGGQPPAVVNRPPQGPPPGFQGQGQGQGQQQFQRGGQPPAVVNRPPQPQGPPPGFQGPPKQWQKPGTGIGAVQPKGPPPPNVPPTLQRGGPPPPNVPPPVQRAAPPPPPTPPRVAAPPPPRAPQGPPAGFAGPPKQWQKPATGVGAGAPKGLPKCATVGNRPPCQP